VLRSSQTAALLPPKPVALLSSPGTNTTPSIGHKRPRLEPDESLEENQVQEMVTSMEVDLQVHSILNSLSTFFQTFAILLDESATRVDLLLKGLQGHAPIFSKKSSPPSSPSYLNQEPSAPLPVTSKPSSSTFSIFSFNYTQLFCLFCIYIIFLSRSVHAFPSSSSSPVAPPLRIMSINANGLFNPMKINAIQDMVHGFQPHILVVGETKSTSEVSSRLLLPGYDSFENPGQQTS